MGRAPCCDKANVKRGPWSPEEDAKLKSYIEKHGTGGNWIALPQKIGLKRCGKSCRLRWLNYLRPNIKHGGFSEEEDNIICSLYISIGSRWSIIAAQLPGRTDNDIKNYWNTRLKKKLLGKHRKEQQAARRSGGGGLIKRGSSSNSGISSILPAAADDSNNNQTPYWPELPVLLAPLPNNFSNHQEPSFNDHASIRKLLIKLGGRFNSDDHHHHNIQQQPPIQDNINGSTTTNLQFPVDIIPSSTQQIYDQQQSSAPMALSNISPHEFAQTHYTEGGGGMQNMFQGQSSNYHLLTELKGMVYNNPQRLDGLEFLYGEDFLVMNERMNSTASTSTTYGESIGWGEMLVCPPVATASDDYDQCMQRMMPQAQECGFNGLISYPGVQ